MGFNFDITAAAPVLKQRYTDKTIDTLIFRSPMLGLMPKNPNYGGSLYVGAVRNAVQSSVSSVDTIAFTTGSASNYVQWQCPWKQGFASANLTGQAIDQCNGDLNALVDVMVGEEDGAYEAIGMHAATCLWGNGGGAIGQISSGSNVGTTTITLADTSKIVGFYIGQILQSASDDGTGGAGVRTGTVTITAVDVNAGTLTASGNWSAGITGCAASDYLFRQGDYNNVLQGVPAWIVPVPVGSTTRTVSTFNNVTCSNDPARLAGQYYVGNGASKSESMIQLLTLIGMLGGQTTHFFANNLDYADIVRELGSRVQYVTESAFKQPQVSFSGVMVATEWGDVRIFRDPFAPKGQGWAIDMKTWLLPSMGKVPKPATKSITGLDWIPLTGSDSFTKHLVYRAATYCSAPGKNGVVTF